MIVTDLESLQLLNVTVVLTVKPQNIIIHCDIHKSIRNELLEQVHQITSNKGNSVS